MKGIVFNMFNDLVEEKFGYEVWDALLEATGPNSDGVYTSADTYDDQELFGLVGALSNVTEVPVSDLIKVFGEYSLVQFTQAHPEFFADKSAKELLLSVDKVIHVEVRKLHPGVMLPEFTYEEPGPDRLVMKYVSPRKLCSFAEGLISGTATHYDVPIEIAQTKCLHQGDDHCRFELEFGTNDSGA